MRCVCATHARVLCFLHARTLTCMFVVVQEMDLLAIDIIMLEEAAEFQSDGAASERVSPFGKRQRAEGAKVAPAKKVATFKLKF